MKKAVLIAAGITALIAFGTVLSVVNKPDMTTKTAPQPVAPNTVNIRDFTFSPARLVIKKGTTVTWINMDTARHDIAPKVSGAEFPGSQKLLTENESYSFTFTKAGVYDYQCSPHPYMKGTIEVTE